MPSCAVGCMIEANREAKAKRTRAKFKQPATWNNTSAQRMDAMRAQTTTKAFFTRPNELGLHRACSDGPAHDPEG